MSSEEDNSESDTESLRSQTTVQSEKPTEIKPDHRIYNASSYHVYKDYSCRLERNRNKFYLIQLLEKAKRYFVYSRWGKKGNNGQQRMSAPFEDTEEAVRMFNKRFEDKTGVDWDNRDFLEGYKGMYKIQEDDLSLKSKQQEQETLPSSAQDLYSKQLEKEKDPLEKSAIILKDVCYEINVLKSDKTNEIVKRLTGLLVDTCPDAFSKKKPLLNANDGIKEAFKMLNKYKKKQEMDMEQEK